MTVEIPCCHRVDNAGGDDFENNDSCAGGGIRP